jgi:FKBP-type peptidyl-prolyl cis-trans isomerase 2
VTIDFNPKLAGKVLTFEVTITWIDRTQAVEAPVAE